MGERFYVRSPWLRLPLAWGIVILSVMVIALALLGVIIIGAVRGAIEEVKFQQRDVDPADLREIWRVLTTWRLESDD